MPDPSSIASAAAPQSLVLLVSIDDWQCPIAVGRGEQTFAWLAHAACSHYHRHLSHTHSQALTSLSLTPIIRPVSVSDVDYNIYQPHERIVDHCRHYDTVLVTVTHTDSDNGNGNDTKSTWLSLYQQSQSLTLPLTIELDIKTGSLTRDRDNFDPPSIVCNVTGWRVVHPMKPYKHGLYDLSLSLPLSMELCFQFLINGTLSTCPNYETRVDQWGNTVNYILVRQEPPHYRELDPVDSVFQSSRRPLTGMVTQASVKYDSASVSGRHPRTAPSHWSRVTHSVYQPSHLVTDNDWNASVTPLSVLVSGHCQGVTPSILAQLSMFCMNAQNPSTAVTHASNHVITPIQSQQCVYHYHRLLATLTDVLDRGDSEKCQLLYELLAKYHASLCGIFQQFANNSVVLPYNISAVQFLSLCRICRIIDRRVTAQRCQRIFELCLASRMRTVQPPDEVRVKLASAHSYSRGDTSSGSGSGSLFDDRQSLDYASFLQALIRVSVLKWKPLSSQPSTALETLLTRHLLPFSSLLFLPNPHSRVSNNAINNSSSATQEREREKERIKEKLLYCAVVESETQRLLLEYEERMENLFEALRPTVSDNSVSVVSYDSMIAYIQRSPYHRWWTPNDTAVLSDCWYDESQDEKTSELEKEIERERALANDNNLTATTEKPSIAYKMTKPEFLIFLAKFAECWSIKREAEEAKKLAEIQAAQAAASEAANASKEADKPPSTTTTDTSGEATDNPEAGKGEESKSLDDDSAKASVSALKDSVADSDRERRVEKDRLDDEAFHRSIEPRTRRFFAQFFPLRSEQLRMEAKIRDEQREAEAKEAELKAQQLAAEKAERAASAKAKKEADAKAKNDTKSKKK